MSYALAIPEQRQISRLQDLVRELQHDNRVQEEALHASVRDMRERVTTGVSSAISVMSAAAGGYLEGYFGPENIQIGPVQGTTALGAVLTVVGLTVDDPDAAEAAAAVARGLTSGKAFQAAHEEGTRRRQARAQAVVNTAPEKKAKGA